LTGFWGGGIGKSEDVLGDGEERVFRILRIGTHLELGDRGLRRAGGMYLKGRFVVAVGLLKVAFEAGALAISRH
jgi:hypothetical protein